MMKATVETSPNNALIKYWGMRSREEGLPMNTNMSVAMDDQLKTRTTIMFSEDFKEDEAWLNNIKLDGTKYDEIVLQMSHVKKILHTDLKFKVASINGYETAAGLASSAAGFCALASAASHALGKPLEGSDLSKVSCMVSGSAARSVYGGFVQWDKEGNTTQIADHNYWPEFRCVIAIVSQKEKEISSRVGMKRTMETSSLYPKRIEGMDEKIKKMKGYVLNKDINNLTRLVMQESDNLHSVMLDSWPPIMYLNDQSKQIIHKVIELNKEGVVCGYTFDAGPNGHIYTTEEHVPKILEKINTVDGLIRTLVVKVGNHGPLLLDNSKALIDDDGTVHKSHYNPEKGIVVE